MRAIWKGAVAFGLVNVPVRLYAATGEHEVQLHQVHREDGGRIRYRRTCSVCGETVDTADIAKGYETGAGDLVVLTDEDLAELPLASGHEIEVLEFVPAEQVDPILLQRTYYLEPDKTSAKPYALLRGALEATDRMAVVKVALRQRESMAVLRVRGKVIVLQTLLWPDELRAADFPVLDAEVQVRPQELTMASSLVESLAADFDPTQYTDSYEAAMVALIEQKVSAGHTQAVPAAAGAEAGEGGDVVDLLAALQRSVEKARAGHAASAGAAQAQESKPARRSSRSTAGASKAATSSTGGSRGSASRSSTSRTKGAEATAEEQEEAAPARTARRGRRQAS